MRDCFSQLLSSLFGDGRRSTLEQRLFSSVGLLNAVTNLGGAVALFALGRHGFLVALHLSTGALFFLFYWLSRFRGAQGRPYWDIRVGIHTGELVAGVIGREKFSYDVWGDTVNTASRMESAGAPGRVNISRATYELVRDLFECEERGRVEAKGKGEVEMFFVTGPRAAASATAEYHIGGEQQDANDEQRRRPVQPPRDHPLGVEVAGTQRATA